MDVLHDAPGGTCRVTVLESETTRFLELDGCEEGAMDLRSEEPVFHYLWFHRLSVLAGRVRRALVLGAGAFTATKCLALNHPDADVDAVDVEPTLGEIGRRFFRLDRPEFESVIACGATTRSQRRSPTPHRPRTSRSCRCSASGSASGSGCGSRRR